MQYWEYQHAVLTWDPARERWIGTTMSDEQLEFVGSDAFYGQLGASGWELVGVQADEYEAGSDTSKSPEYGGGPSTVFVTGWRVRSYRFFFKRPRQG